MADGLAVAVEPGARSMVRDERVGRGLADEEKVPICRQNGFAQGLAREQVIAEIDGMKVGVLCRMGLQPAMGGTAFAVLLLCSVLRGDELRFQRDNLLMTGRHQCGPQHGMEILGLAGTALTPGAVRTMDFLGTEILGAVEGNQHAPIQPAEPLQPGQTPAPAAWAPPGPAWHECGCHWGSAQSRTGSGSWNVRGRFPDAAGARKEGLCMKNTETAGSPIPAML